jgi:hypothetical protein
LRVIAASESLVIGAEGSKSSALIRDDYQEVMQVALQAKHPQTAAIGAKRINYN